MIASATHSHNDKREVLKSLTTEALNDELRRRRRQEREEQARRNAEEGKLLREMRELLGLKQGELAKLLRINQVSLSMMETGKRPGARVIIKRIETWAQWKDRREKATPPV